LSFYHPPITLYAYRLFLFFPQPIAYELWCALKVCALVALLSLWSRHFLRLPIDSFTIVYFLLAFNSAIYCDLVAGNVSIFEQLALWAGFRALMGGRYVRFCILLVVVAQLKLTPLFFAVLLLFVPERPQWFWFAGCLAGFVALFSLNHVLQPVLLKEFFHAVSGLDEGIADGNAATLTLIRDVVDRALGYGTSAATRLDEGIFCAVALAIGVPSLAVVLRHRSAAVGRDPKLLIYFACVLFAVLSPRMKNYSYILLLMPTLHLLRVVWGRAVAPVVLSVLVVAVLYPQADSLLPIRVAFELLYFYMPLVAAFVVWLGYLRLLRNDGGEASAWTAARGPHDRSHELLRAAR
jgi:hypothetical protein